MGAYEGYIRKMQFFVKSQLSIGDEQLTFSFAAFSATLSFPDISFSADVNRLCATLRERELRSAMDTIGT